MTVIETTAALSTSLPLADDDSDHWVCCIDENITFCGKNASNATPAEFDVASCVPCEIAGTSIQYEMGMCPLFPNFMCPE